MRYTPGQFDTAGPGPSVPPSIGGGTYTPTPSGSFSSVGPYVTPSVRATPMSPQPLTPSTPPLFKGGAAPIKQVNPYGINNGNGYYHGSNRWSGRQVMDRPNPITRIDGNVVPLPAHATAGSTPRRPIIPAIGYGGTSQDNPNPGVGSMSVGPSSGTSGSGSGKLITPGTGLRGI